MEDRIVCNPDILGGKPVIRGTRISVEFIIELFASGAEYRDILEAYPHLNREDIQAALQYASRFIQNEVFVTLEDAKA